MAKGLPTEEEPQITDTQERGEEPTQSVESAPVDFDICPDCDGGLVDMGKNNFVRCTTCGGTAKHVAEYKPGSQVFYKDGLYTADENGRLIKQ